MRGASKPDLSYNSNGDGTLIDSREIENELQKRVQETRLSVVVPMRRIEMRILLFIAAAVLLGGGCLKLAGTPDADKIALIAAQIEPAATTTAVPGRFLAFTDTTKFLESGGDGTWTATNFSISGAASLNRVAVSGTTMFGLDTTTANRIYRSTDRGLTWSQLTTAGAASPFSELVACNGKVAFFYGGGTGVIAYSTSNNGTSFTGPTTVAGPASLSVGTAACVGTTMFVSYGTPNTVSRSTDGTTWTAATTYTSGAGIFHMAGSGSTIFGTGGGPMITSRSTDGGVNFSAGDSPGAGTSALGGAAVVNGTGVVGMGPGAGSPSVPAFFRSSNLGAAGSGTNSSTTFNINYCTFSPGIRRMAVTNGVVVGVGTAGSCGTQVPMVVRSSNAGSSAANDSILSLHASGAMTDIVVYPN